MKKFFLFLIFLIVLLAVGAQFALPSYLESQVQSELDEALHPSSQTIDISSMPAFKLTYGEVDEVKGTLENVKLGKLNFNHFQYSAEGLKINPVSLLMSREIDVISANSASLEGIVLADDLKTFLVDNTPGLENGNVKLSNEKITVSGSVNLLGALRGQGNLEGNLELKDNVLSFAPTRFTINGSTVGGLTSQVLEPITIYDFNTFPIPVKAESVSVESDEIHIKIKPVII